MSADAFTREIPDGFGGVEFGFHTTFGTNAMSASRDGAVRLWHTLGDVLGMEHSEGVIRERDELRAACESLHAEVDAVAEQRDTLANRIDSLERQNADLKRQRSALVVMIGGNPDSRIVHLERQVEGLRRDRDAWRATADERRARLDAIGESAEMLEDALRRVRA